VLTRQANRDHIAVHWHSEQPDAVSEALLATHFRDHCRLRADVFQADAGLAPQDYALHDERRDDQP
jgi:hypothetical protein